MEGKRSAEKDWLEKNVAEGKERCPV